VAGDETWIDLNGIKVRADDPSDVIYDFGNDMHLRSDDRMYFNTKGSVIGTDRTFRVTKRGTSTDGSVRFGPVSSGGIGASFDEPNVPDSAPAVRRASRRRRPPRRATYQASMTLAGAFLAVAGFLLFLNLSETGQAGWGVVLFFGWPFALLTCVALIVDWRYAQGLGPHPGDFWEGFANSLPPPSRSRRRYW